jgi:hypothetical protein
MRLSRPTWVVRNGDDKVEDDVVGQQVEEVLAVDESRQALLDAPETDPGHGSRQRSQSLDRLQKAL